MLLEKNAMRGVKNQIAVCARGILKDENLLLVGGKKLTLPRRKNAV